ATRGGPPRGWARVGAPLYPPGLPAGPGGGAFPAGELLTYDVELDTGGTALRLAGLGPPGGTGALGYAGFQLPSFFLQAPDAPLHVLHGSCRKLHGKGEDAFWCADELLADTAADLTRR